MANSAANATGDAAPSNAAVGPSRAQRAYAATLPELQGLEEAEVSSVNIDVPVAITTALSCVEHVRGLLERVAQLPELDVTRVTQLERYTLTLAQAHALWIAAEGSEISPSELLLRSRQARHLLREDVRFLARRGLLDGSCLTPSKTGRGRRDIAFELLFLCALIRQEWAALESKSLLSWEQLDEAEALADRLLLGAGRRSPRSPESALRERAFTLFLRAYDETRRAVSFLLWREGDVDATAPSLYAARRKPRRRQTRAAAHSSKQTAGKK